jgi:hypothetical protein
MSMDPGTRCSVCERHHRTLIGRDDSELRLCSDCFARLDQLDLDHVDPAWSFAAAIVANREAAWTEGVW